MVVRIKGEKIRVSFQFFALPRSTLLHCFSIIKGDVISHVEEAVTDEAKRLGRGREDVVGQRRAHSESGTRKAEISKMEMFQD